MSKIDRTGETNVNHQGFKMTIIKYESYDKTTVEFEDKYKTQTVISYQHFKNGFMRNPSFIWLAGRILIDKNDVNENPIAYQKYRAMIDRCYGKQKYNNVVYKGCEVCKEWFDFENFVKWFNENYYTIENESMELDKDLFGDGKLYSPNTCIFVPHKLNSWFAVMGKNNQERLNENLPTGVSYHKGRGYKHYRVVSLEKGQLFYTPEEAYEAYKANTELKFKNYAEQHKDAIPLKLYEKLINYEI